MSHSSPVDRRLGGQGSVFVVEVWSLQRAVPFDGVMKAGDTLRIEDQEGLVTSEAHLTS
ncbi:MAG: hypothetical protein HN453_11560 [Gammaproteobacteria bacterium]|nr:hypothetical protein [Gammaproteobacteria bacterium]